MSSTPWMHDVFAFISDHWIVCSLFVLFIARVIWRRTASGQRAAKASLEASKIRRRARVQRQMVAAEQLASPTGFTKTDRLMDVENRRGIALDTKHHQLWLVSVGASAKRVVPYGALLSVEISEDGHSISSTSRKSQAAGIVVGALALGGFGALVGGLTGSRKTTTFVDKLSLRLLINDTSDSIHEIVLLNNTKTLRSSQAYLNASKEAQRWEATLKAVIAQADELDQSQRVVGATANSADEIRKLASLREEGVLTDSEFLALKAKILR